MFSWSRDGHKLVSASTDNIVSQWDVLTGDCDQRFRFPSPILKLQCHPRDMWVLHQHLTRSSDDLRERTVSPVSGTRSWCVPWSRPQSCWLCQTANTLCCPWTTIRTWTWWQRSTGGASTSTPATPKERSASRGTARVGRVSSGPDGGSLASPVES